MMDGWSDGTFTALLVTVQILGIAGVVGVRASEGTRWHGILQVFYFLAFALVGMGIMASVARASNSWMCGAVTLTIMFVGAILESARSAALRQSAQF